MELRPAGLFYRDIRTNGRAERQGDITNLIVAFQNFSNAPEKPVQQWHAQILHCS
jgi:hypothetical protein